MRRAWRKLLTLAAFTLVGGPMLDVEQAVAQPARVVRIAMLGNEATPVWQGLHDELRKLGYFEGRNMQLELRWSGGYPGRLPSLAEELVALAPDVIVVSGTQAALAAAGATKKIPIVMAISQHPEELGLAQSLARPGGNVTGLTTYSPQLTAKRVQLLREIVPGITRLALLWSPDSTSQQIQYGDLLAVAPSLGLSIVSIELASPDDLAGGLARAKASGAHALMAIGNPVTFRGRRQIAEFTLAHGLPSVFDERLFADAGGLMSYGPNFRDLSHRAASHVDKILKGARPADLPIERPLRFELVINRKSAATLGLVIPPATVLRADQLLD